MGEGGAGSGGAGASEEGRGGAGDNGARVARIARTDARNVDAVAVGGAKNRWGVRNIRNERREKCATRSARERERANERGRFGEEGGEYGESDLPEQRKVVGKNGAPLEHVGVELEAGEKPGLQTGLAPELALKRHTDVELPPLVEEGAVVVVAGAEVVGRVVTGWVVEGTTVGTTAERQALEALSKKRPRDAQLDIAEMELRARERDDVSC